MGNDNLLNKWSWKIWMPPKKSPEIKSRLLFRRKAMTNLNSVLKSGDITLPTKVRIVKLVFLHGESPWTEESGGATVRVVTKSWTQLSN